MVIAKESYAYINYITLFLQELLHQRIGFCTKVIYYAPKSGSSLNCIVFSSVIEITRPILIQRNIRKTA